MQAPPALERRPVRHRIDPVHKAILRAAAHAAESWQSAWANPAGAVHCVLAAERRLGRQLGALQMLMDKGVRGQLQDALSQAQTPAGALFVAAWLLMQHDRRAGEASVFAQLWRTPEGPRRQALEVVLKLLGVADAGHLAHLNRALGSAAGDVVAQATALVACVGGPRAWQTPRLVHAAGLGAALRLMGEGLIAPQAAILARGAAHADAAVRRAAARAQTLLYPAQALAQARAKAHSDSGPSGDALRLLGLLYNAGERLAERDFALLAALCAEAEPAPAAIDALGLTGCARGAQACIKAALRCGRVLPEAKRCLQTIFGLDAETWAALAAAAGGNLTADMLAQGLTQAHLGPSLWPLQDFELRGAAGLVARLRACDVQHFRDRACEQHMRTGGRHRLCTWSFVTPQLRERR